MSERSKGALDPAKLKQTLHRLYSRETGQKHFPDDSFTRSRRGIHEFVDGEYVNTPFGDVFVAQVRYPRSYVHGRLPLKATQTITGEWLSRWGRFSTFKKFNFRKTVFVDTETSGLAGGGGTIAFLIGIGYYYRGLFRVEQFFADSFSREEGMLDLVADFVRPFDTLVTFNGKAFDIPLLETRYLLKRKQSPFSRMEHLDLLHLSRQLWNLSLDNCKLQTIERDILGFRRDHDLPGNEIPQVYFDYIRLGNPDPLFRVFQHNADDIASLSGVTYLLWQEMQEDKNPRDVLIEFSRSKILNRYGETGRAIKSLELLRVKQVSTKRKMFVLLQLSMIYKSSKNWEKAVSLWLEMVESSPFFLLLPYVELAKYFEHRSKEIERAREMVEKALARIPAHRFRDIEELQYRLNRIQKKLEKMEARKS